MGTSTGTKLNWEKACALLGTAPDASDAEIRAAYLEQVRRHPPDRDPEQFELVRDAYEKLRDPRQRAMQALDGPDVFAPLVDLLGEPTAAKRCFVGLDPWLAVLKEKRT